MDLWKGITPPLSPVFSVQEEIENEVEETDEMMEINLDMLSSGPDLGEIDLDNIEQSLALQDALISSESAKDIPALAKIYPQMGMLLESSSDFPRHKVTDSTLRVEVPL